MPKPGTTTERGYGSTHQRERRRWADRLRRAGSLPCARCGEPIEHGEKWDLGHTDDRTAYIGPEHRACNRGDGAARGNRARGTRGPVIYRRRIL